VGQPDIDQDLELLLRITRRDDAALARLYDRHSRLVYSVILRMLRSPSDAEEVLQETFVRVWSRAETYDARLGSPSAWMLRIARNRAVDQLRARRVRANFAVDTGQGVEERSPEPSTNETPEVVLQEHSTAAAVYAALSALPDSQRTLIEAAFYDGCTHHELSVRFGLPLGTVKTRIRTGLITMRGRLEHSA